MTIDRIGSIDPIQPGKRPGRVSQVNQAARTDSISFSPEAVEKGALYHAMDLAASVPDVRMDRVAELKAKINDPSYLNGRIIEATADKIMDAFGL